MTGGGTHSSHGSQTGRAWGVDLTCDAVCLPHGSHGAQTNPYTPTLCCSVMRAAVAWVCVAAWACLGLLQARGDTVSEMTPWRMVMVEPTRFGKGTATEATRTLRRSLCGMACVKEPWCFLWCSTLPDQCLLSSYIVSASYVPSQPTGARICYTMMQEDLVVGAVAASSAQNPSYPARVVANLVDGYYSHDMADCARITYAAPDGAWFQFDLGFVYTVTEVVLWAQPNVDASQLFRDIEVRVGVSPAPSPGEFSTFTLLGNFPGPGVMDMVVELRVAKPLQARYVSIQRMTSGDLQIAHLEIR